MARPKKYTPEFKKKLLEKFEKYIDDTYIPIFKEFCYQNDILAVRVYEFEEFSYSIKRCSEKKEANLEREALKPLKDSKVNYKFAIFSLKQLGWKDNPTIEKDENKDEDLVFEGW